MASQQPAKPLGTPGYTVSSPQGRCVVCSQPIEPGQSYMAALRETATGFERLDACHNCWSQLNRSDILGFWKTTMPHPQQKRKLFVDDEVLCNLFERLADTEEPNKINFRFVLGLILMRKRKLVHESARQENGKEIWSVRFRGREDKLDLIDPKLTEQQIADVAGQLNEILNEEL